MSNLQLPITAFIFSSILAVNFYSKKRINLIENRVYSYMLLMAIVDSLLVIIVQFGAITSFLSNNIIYLLNKIDFVILIIFICSLLFYTMFITYNINTKLRRILVLIFTIFNIITSIVLFFLDLNLIENNGLYSVSGSATILVYTLCAMYLGATILITLVNYKSITKRHIPIFSVIGLLGLLTIFYVIDPYLIIISITITAINYIMYFTIENPDVKMIHQLDLAVGEANKANLAKSDFLSSMSHEIRTPLNAIAGLTQDMLDSGKLPSDLVEDANDIVGASNTLVEIVGNIIDISKIESQKMDVINTRYDIKEITNNVIAINKVRIGEKDVKLSVNYAKDLPHELYGDKSHIKQIINNLVSNAVKYTEKGFVKVNIRCINKKDVSLIMISVEDTGRGIKKNDVDKLFIKFERLGVEKNTTTEGTGLGLAITKKLIDLLGGKINVQSSFGYGSLFIAQIPQKISRVTVEEKEDIYIPKDIDLSGKKVLVVDDNLLNIKVARRALEPLNLLIEEVTNGIDAISRVKTNSYDVILMDIMMPELNGEDTLIKLREIDGFNTPVIALTADAISGAKNKYLELGFCEYVAKPFNKEQIKIVLESVLK